MTDQERYQQAVEAVAEIIRMRHCIFPSDEIARQILSLSGDWGRVAVAQDKLPDNLHMKEMLKGFVQEIKPDGGKG